MDELEYLDYLDRSENYYDSDDVYADVLDKIDINLIVDKLVGDEENE